MRTNFNNTNNMWPTKVYLTQREGLSACFADSFCIARTSCLVLRVIGLYGQSWPASPDTRVTGGLGADVGGPEGTDWG